MLLGGISITTATLAQALTLMKMHLLNFKENLWAPCGTVMPFIFFMPKLTSLTQQNLTLKTVN